MCKFAINVIVFVAVASLCHQAEGSQVRSCNKQLGWLNEQLTHRSPDASLVSLLSAADSISKVDSIDQNQASFVNFHRMASNDSCPGDDERIMSDINECLVDAGSHFVHDPMRPIDRLIQYDGLLLAKACDRRKSVLSSFRFYLGDAYKYIDDRLLNISQNEIMGNVEMLRQSTEEGSFLHEALSQILDLDPLLTNENFDCSPKTYDVLLRNWLGSSFDRSGPINRLVARYMEQHAEGCRATLLSQFDLQLGAMGKLEVRLMVALIRTLSLFPFADSPIELKQIMRDESLINILARNSNLLGSGQSDRRDTRMFHERLWRSLVDLASDDPDRDQLNPNSDSADTMLRSEKEGITRLVTKYLVEPCKRITEPFKSVMENWALENQKLVQYPEKLRLLAREHESIGPLYIGHFAYVTCSRVNGDQHLATKLINYALEFERHKI